MCGTCSNKNGMKLMLLRSMHRQQSGRTEFTLEELSSVLAHQALGSPHLSILGFEGGFHGQTIRLLSCSNTRYIQGPPGVDIPSLARPAPLPTGRQCGRE